MKNHNQALLVALAVTFALALTLTVALICLSYAKEGSAHSVTRTGGSLVTSTPPPTGTATTGPLLTTTAATTKPVKTDPPKLGNGLAFTVTGKGESRVTGMGTCTDACVVIPEYDPNGNRVTSIAPSAFYGCATVTAIQIPKTVTYIGDGAFAGCGGLVYLSVSEGNPAYRDLEGVLYSADGRTLILYPPMRAGSSVHIPRSVTLIKEMAFYNCFYLKTVTYGGSPAEWERIHIESKNYSLTAAAKTFEGGGEK